MKHKYIAIEGNIGAGKTSLANLLALDYGANLVLEGFDDNPFLPKFYDKPEQFAFPLELSFLAGRYHQLKKSFPSPDLFRPLVVSDYYFYKSLLFAKANLEEDEYKLFYQLFEIIYEKLPKPDLLVYLHLDPDRLLYNIKHRGRPYEQTIGRAYLEKIQNTYFSYFRNELSFPVLIIDTSEIDFVKKVSDYQYINNLLRQNYPLGTHRIFG